MLQILLNRDASHNTNADTPSPKPFNKKKYIYNKTQSKVNIKARNKTKKLLVWRKKM